MVSKGKNVAGFQAETRTRNQKASKEPKKHLLCWPLTFASVSLQNDFLGSDCLADSRPHEKFPGEKI